MYRRIQHIHRKKHHLLLTGVLLFTFLSLTNICHAQVETYYVKAIQTNPNYNSTEDSSTIMRNISVDQDKLFVFLGGTGSSSSNAYIQLGRESAKLGFDFINLSYPNTIPAASFANDNDTLAFDKYREEVCFGTPLSASVSVDSLNAITSRILHLLQYLEANAPAENWGQYLINSNTIDWAKVILGGHSQGAGHAAYIAKFFPVERVLMFSGPNDYSTQFSNSANWLRQPGLTEIEKYFSYLSLNDEVVDYDKQFINLTGLGMLNNDDTTLVDNKNTPYENSHTLYTTQTFGLFSNHSAPVVFSAINTEVWIYMLTSPIVTKIRDVNSTINFSVYPNPSNSMVRLQTDENFIGRTYFLRNIEGQVVQTSKILSTDQAINTEFLSPGIYLFSIDDFTYKLIKN